MADFYGQNDAPDTKPAVPVQADQIQPQAPGASDVELTPKPRADMTMTAAPEMPDIPKPAQPPAEARPAVETLPSATESGIQVQTVEKSGEPPHLVLDSAEVVPDASLEKTPAQESPTEVPLTTDRAVIEPIHAIEKEMEKSAVAEGGDHAAKAYTEILEADGVPDVAAGEVKLEEGRKLAA